VTRSFKTNVRERVLQDGKCTSLSIALSRGLPGRKGSIIALGRSGDESAKSRNRKSSYLTAANIGGGQVPTIEKLTSHWIPLKDADGLVKWVVLVLLSTA
jgi:hypothetical protein